MFADYNCEITGWIKENLIAENADLRVQRNGFAMMSKLWKRLLFCNAIRVPLHTCHPITLNDRKHGLRLKVLF